MKKILVILFAVMPLVFSCSEYQRLLKSEDYDLLYDKAMSYYESGDYLRSSDLIYHKSLTNVFRGTEKSENLSFVYADCLYKNGDYLLAGHSYRQFIKNFPRSEHSEECQFMSAYCYYLDSPNARLDQTETYNALDEFQLFLNLYPNSDRAEEATSLMKELQDKLVYKQYLSAKLYFDLGNYMGNNYLSAVIAAQNCLKQYPDTKYREELSFLILDSKYIQADKSVQSKKTERMRDAIDEYYSFINDYPESEYSKKAVKIYESASKYMSSHTEN